MRVAVAALGAGTRAAAIAIRAQKPGVPDTVLKLPSSSENLAQD
ncbi:hypothetical protein FHT17_004051 [Novosphingobium sp. SG916]|nr:hypothetical protein [Novosphingobium sp. SG916]